MTSADRLRARLSDRGNERSLAAKSRARRLATFLKHHPSLAEMRVLDLGGTAEWWDAVPSDRHPKEVVTLNLEKPRSGSDRVHHRYGDACDPPCDLRHSFDLVFSNSLLEHVGGHWRRQRLADVIRAAAPRHWVQTPYRYFPIEPHYIFPGHQFLPLVARALIAEHWPLTGYPGRKAEAALRLAAETELVSLTEFRLLFPDAEILLERFAGLPKSLVAVRS